MPSQANRLTTVDNPYNPFTEFTNWFQFDVLNGYNSCEYLARIAETSDTNSDEENNIAINKAIDEIIELDFMQLYKKVSPEIDEETENNDSTSIIAD